MKVLLLQDVAGQGKKGDTVKVSDGYARNYLIPRKLAKELTPALMTDLANQEASRQRKLEAERAQWREVAAKVEGLNVVIAVQIGAGGKFYGSITTKEIADELKSQHGVEIDRRKIQQNEQIKALGSYTLDVKYFPEVTGKLNLIVTEKK